MYIEQGRWVVQDMRLSRDKLSSIWRMLKRQRTLFSDLTSNDVSNFVGAVTASNSVWFEVREHGVLVGVIYFSDLHLVTDCLAHMVFFDRNIIEKQEVCIEVMKWMFHNFPLERMTVTPPMLYKKTIHFLKVVGFKQEGLKRRASLIGGRWWDQAMYGITRQEVEAL